MKISEVILHLEQLLNEYGDLNVLIEEPHEYWGTLQFELNINGIEVNDNAMTNGPKSGKVEKAVVIGTC